MRPDRETIATLLVVIAFAAVPFVASALDNNYIVTMATRIAIYGLAALSLDLLIGRSALLSFGHAAYFGLGGYVVAMAAFHLTNNEPILGLPGTNEALVAWPIAMAVSGLAALVIGALSLRTAGVYFIMITLAFAQMIYFVFVALKYYGGDDGLSMSTRNLFAGQRVTDPKTYYWICVSILALCALLSRRIVNSRFGLVLRGAAASERRMQALGFPVYRYRLAAFVIAGLMAGLAGALWANLNRFVAPDMMNWTRSGEFMVMVVMGGLGSTLGPIVGAAAFMLVETFISGKTEFWPIVFGPFIILVAMFAPRGVWGLIRGGAPK